MGISQRLFDLIPNRIIKNGAVVKKLNRIGDIMGRPMQNRLIMGGTAILTQPYIDDHNKRVDKETAHTSRNRTIGKILAGTAVGCLVRGGVYKLVNMTTNKDISIDRWDNLLTPRSSSTLFSHLVKNRMRNYRTTISMILAMLIMLGTNIILDVPLTNKISNFLNKLGDKKKKQPAAQAPPPPVITTSPADKIKHTFNINKGGIS